MKATSFLILALSTLLFATSSDNHLPPKQHHPIIAIKQANEILSHIEIGQLPYRVNFSLGDELDFKGLTIIASYDDESWEELTTGYTLEGGDTLTLGKQLITVNYQNKLASFEIDVSNLGTVVLPIEPRDLLISEIISGNGFHAIEIFNGSGLSFAYDDYELRIHQGSSYTSVSLPNLIKNNDVLVLVNDDTQLSLPPGATLYVDASLELASVTRLALYDKVQQKVLDNVDFLLSDGNFITIDGPFDSQDIHLIRDYKIGRPTTNFRWLDWRIGTNMDSLGLHTLVGPLIDIETQAVAYGRYVMYGIGMNAATDPFGAFARLREEYNYMHSETKQFFLTNKNHQISGINESGKFVTNTFNDAIGRYNYLAARTDNPGLTSTTSSINWDWEEIGKFALFGVIIVIAGGIYVVIKKKFSY